MSNSRGGMWQKLANINRRWQGNEESEQEYENQM